MLILQYNMCNVINIYIIFCKNLLMSHLNRDILLRIRSWCRKQGNLSICCDYGEIQKITEKYHLILNEIRAMGTVIGQL